MLDSN